MSQDEFTPRRPEYSDEPRPRKRERPPQREDQPTSGFPWAPVLTVSGILAVVGCCGIGGFFLMFPAIQKVREAAARTQSTNNLMQLVLAVHNCNDAKMAMPHVSGPWKDPPGNTTERTLFTNLLPYVEQDVLYKDIVQRNGSTNQLIKTYVSPADFTGNGSGGECSYAANWQVFQLPSAGPGGPQQYASIPRSFPDGQLNTIMFAEIYQNCNGTVRRWGQTGNASAHTTPAFNRMTQPNPATINTQLQMFQIAPKQTDCSPPLAQTPHAGGLLVGLGDGSVRNLYSNLSITTWRRACAPADGNVLGQFPATDDW